MSHNTNIVGGTFVYTYERASEKRLKDYKDYAFNPGMLDWFYCNPEWKEMDGWVYGTFIRNPVIWSLDIKFSPVDSNLFNITSSKLEIGYQCGQMLHNSSPNHKLNHGTFAGINIFNIQYIHELLQSVSRYRNIAIQHFTNRCPDVSTKFSSFCPNCKPSTLPKVMIETDVLRPHFATQHH